MRQQDTMVHNSQDGSGIGRHMTQVMEHWIKHMKTHCRRNCNHGKDWNVKLFKYFDCLTIGCIGYDLIDFNNCETQFTEHLRMIYEPTTTPALEGHILSQMPTNFYKYWNIVHGIKFRGIIPNNIKIIWNQHLRQQESLNNIRVYMNHIDNAELMNDYSSWDELSDEELEKNITNMNKYTKKKILQQMQDSMLANI